jgi:hypothetical protein
MKANHQNTKGGDPGIPMSEAIARFSDGADLEFTDIRITEPTGHEAQIECVEWLRERKEQGESRKKEVLREEARRRFGAALILLPRLHAKSGTMGRLPQ